MDKYYIYFHINLITNEVFYVGKGSGRRATSKKNRSDWWKRTVNKYGYDILLVDENITEDLAFELEKYYIKKIGRRDLGLGPLVNMTDGGEGEGKSGHIISDATKEKCRLINLKYNTLEEKKEALRLNAKRWRAKQPKKEKQPMSAESRKNMSEAKKGIKRKPFTKETKLKMSEAKKGSSF